MVHGRVVVPFACLANRQDQLAAAIHVDQLKIIGHYIAYYYHFVVYYIYIYLYVMAAFECDWAADFDSLEIGRLILNQDTWVLASSQSCNYCVCSLGIT